MKINVTECHITDSVINLNAAECHIIQGAIKPNVKNIILPAVP
jgi:hypothetical protein